MTTRFKFHKVIKVGISNGEIKVRAKPKWNAKTNMYRGYEETNIWEGRGRGS